MRDKACREIYLDMFSRGYARRSSCGQPRDENSNIAANKWLMATIPPVAVLVRGY